MVVIGACAHKRSHTPVAIDHAGRKLAEKTVLATPEGHLVAARWAARWQERVFALEDCRHLTRQLEIDLLAVGEAAVRVPPHLMPVQPQTASKGRRRRFSAGALRRLERGTPSSRQTRRSQSLRERRSRSSHVPGLEGRPLFAPGCRCRGRAHRACA